MRALGKSYANLEAAIEKARKLVLQDCYMHWAYLPLVYLMRNISRAFGYDWSRLKMLALKNHQIDGIGNIMAKAYLDFFQNEKIS